MSSIFSIDSILKSENYELNSILPLYKLNLMMKFMKMRTVVRV